MVCDFLFFRMLSQNMARDSIDPIVDVDTHWNIGFESLVWLYLEEIEGAVLNRLITYK